MAVCGICDQEAGWFKHEHEDCVRKYNAAQAEISELASIAALDPDGQRSFVERMKQIADKGKLLQDAWELATQHGFEKALAMALEDRLLSEDEEERLAGFGSLPGIEFLKQTSAWTRVVQAAALRDVMEGRVPNRMQISGSTDRFMLRRDEKAVWLFSNAEYLEDRVQRSTVGGYGGLSVRVMRGVYLRSGMFKGQPIERTAHVSLGAGMLLVTDEALYVSCPKFSKRIPLDDIITIETFSDGIAICKDGGKHQYFKVAAEDAWFFGNLVHGLVSLQNSELTRKSAGFGA